MGWRSEMFDGLEVQEVDSGVVHGAEDAHRSFEDDAPRGEG